MGRKRARGVRRGEQQWTEIVRRFESSGLAARRFCDREGVPLSSLQRWQRRLGSVAPAKFMEIVAPVSRSNAIALGSLEITLPNGTTLRFQV